MPNAKLTNGERKMTLKELLDYHQKQAIYFEPFGASNAVTLFHLTAVEVLKEAISHQLGERERSERG